MSRTTLCVLTAAVLAVLSVALVLGRFLMLGDQVQAPIGPGAWRVTLLVQGRTTRAHARLTTARPLSGGRQQVVHEVCRSTELLPGPQRLGREAISGRHRVLWTVRPGITEGPFRARYEFYCKLDAHQPSSHLARPLYAAPSAGEHLSSEPGIESTASDVWAWARQLTAGWDHPQDQLQALYRFVDEEVRNEPTVRGPTRTAAECFRAGAGDAAAKSRLLVALCRSRGFPARLATGLVLKKGHEQTAHTWVEAWLRDRWLPMCPFYHHFGTLPANYLLFHFGDRPIARGRHVSDLDYAFLVERPAAEAATPPGQTSRLRRLLLRLSLYALPPAERHLVEYLLLLPLAALIVCLYRNVIGLSSFGTFAPALIGLAFRDLNSLPGILVFVAIVLVGWLLRRGLDAYHLLQVPRTAFLLSLVVVLLVALIVLANYYDLSATRYISLFPMVILTGMIERFWTLEAEDSTTSSFRTLLGTLVIAASISLVLSLPVIVGHLLRFPETLGVVMAAQLLLGRYTGYRVSELLRFRDFLTKPGAAAEGRPYRVLHAAFAKGEAHVLAVDGRAPAKTARDPGDEPAQRGLHPGPQPAGPVPGGG
jgi:hypothetical protein